MSTTSPCWHIHTCSWPPQLSMCTPLTSATLTAWLGLMLLDLEVPPRIKTAIVDPLQFYEFYKNHLVVDTVNHSGQSWKNIMPAQTHCCHIFLHMTFCTIRPRVTASSSMLPPISKKVPLLKSVRKAWKRWMLLQMHRCLCKSTRTQKIQGNMSPPK